MSSSFGCACVWVQPKPLSHVNGLICNICGDDVGVTVDGELFVACFECGFPVCRPCFEYERKEGNQSCPQCKSRYNRQKGNKNGNENPPKCVCPCCFLKSYIRVQSKLLM